jgi:hypothetical protein
VWNSALVLVTLSLYRISLLNMIIMTPATSDVIRMRHRYRHRHSATEVGGEGSEEEE